MQEQLILQTLLEEFEGKLNRLKEVLPRDARFPDAPSKIKIAIGMRRVGKTYFLYQQILKLIENGVSKTCILYINFEDDRLLPLDQQRLGKLIDAFYAIYPENHDKKCYLFLDEIQNASGWPLVIRRLHDSKNVEIFLTGSSAKLLSKEIATSLRGRSLAIEIWPYSFSEFMRAKKQAIAPKAFGQKTKDKLFQLFNEYLSQGGFPEVTSVFSDVRQKILQEYIDIVIYRDIIERHNIKNPSIIKYMILSMLHNVGKPFSVNKFYNDLQTQGYKVGKDFFYECVDYISDAYLSFTVPLYNESMRKIQANPKKLYAIDPGIVRSVTMDYEKDLGRLFENVIYLELKRLGGHISYYLTSDRYEIDFLVETPLGQRKFFQVAWEIEKDTTFQREQRALQGGLKELGVAGELITLESFLRNGIQL